MTLWRRSRGHTPPEVWQPLGRKEIEKLRYRGCRGGFISRHRAVLFSPFGPAKLAELVLLLGASLALWYWILDYVTGFWGAVMDFWCRALGIGGASGRIHYSLAGVVHFTMPNVYVPSALPTTFLWWCGVLITVLLVVISLIIPRTYLPIAYLLRIVALFQATAQIFFAFWPGAFPYSSSGYLQTVLLASLALISLIPLILAFTYYIFDFGILRSVILTVLIMVHLTVMVPLQYSMHAWVIHHGSLLFLPVLFFVFALPLAVLVFIAFFAWGFSWHNCLNDQEVQWKLRKRFV